MATLAGVLRDARSLAAVNLCISFCLVSKALLAGAPAGGGLGPEARAAWAESRPPELWRFVWL